MSEATINIVGLPHIPSIKEVNVRSGPGSNNPMIFKRPVGERGLTILDIQPDEDGKHLQGKAYQWFKLQFGDGSEGWVRSDLLALVGDGSRWGYPAVSEPTLAFDLTRGEPVTPATTEATAQEAAGTGDYSWPPNDDDIARVKTASLAITAAFEGTGYAAYNNYDAGIVSYGLIQFTLAAGSLQTVLEKYLSSSNSETAQKLNGYMHAVRVRNPQLRHDVNFKHLLLAAANETEMQAAQDAVATVKYWDAVWNGYIAHRMLRWPLTWALLFDMGVNFGTGHGFVRLAEKNLGVPSRSIPGQNGITEEQLITEVARLRKISHDRQADRDNLPGLRVRGDFWVNRVQQGDWGLQGDANGHVNANGHRIGVR